MAFVFTPDTHTVSDTIRALACTELTLAAKRARNAKPNSSPLHRLRKHIKKTRGLLRLTAPAFSDFDIENKALREAAAGISNLRDAEVLHVTLGFFMGDPANDTAARKLSRALPAPVTAPDPEAIIQFAEQVEAIQSRVKSWEFEAEGWDLLSQGLTRTLHQAQRRMKVARKHPTAENLHAWRSRVKHHWYHTRLLTPIWPEMMAAQASAADTLGEALGLHHDLCALEAALPGPLTEAEAMALGAAITARKDILELQSFAIGARLFADPPEALAARWGKWYKLWRRETAPR
ncbi:CHAD domain-containing protein [Rhodobacter sp. JA431]|uniref:CHAD domain-containing protein n=1 Tax=Rhodobacter sp. JA431 TaxID=570013 RepID=UPI000BC71135|nr:CHAD domain-containing protein [Rhodobacter sp. JA431]SOC05058.1 CHAD domain-containing protein [Rhodobacter sp. JA431]